VQVKKALNKLMKAYIEGRIVYPRTDNDFLPEYGNNVYPHPKISKFDNFYFGVKRGERIKFSDISLPLYFTQMGYITPAIIESISTFTRKYIDPNNAKLKENKKIEAKVISKVFNEFLEYANISKKRLAELLYRPFRKKVIAIKIDNKDFFKPSKENRRLPLFHGNVLLKMSLSELLNRRKLEKITISKITDIMKKNQEKKEVKEEYSWMHTRKVITHGDLVDKLDDAIDKLDDIIDRADEEIRKQKEERKSNNKNVGPRL
jgi:hypothetical protein